MSLRNRRSPSGPATDIQIPILGAGSITASATEYLALGELAGVPDETDGQYLIPQAGVLSSLSMKNIVAGAVSGSVTYNVRKNGVLIAGATGVLANTSVDPLVIQIGAGVVEGDLISIQAVSTAFGGASPIVRSTLLYAPGPS